MPSKSSKSRAASKKKKGQVRESGLALPALDKLRLALTYAPALLMLVIILLLLVGQPLGINLLGDDGQSATSDTYGGIYNPQARLAPFFTGAVQYWEPAIYGWAQEANLNPNLVATIIQIESCGNPYVVSSAGAQGLAQVVPSNFQPGDNQLDLNTNMRTGMQVFRDCLRWSADPNFDGVQDGSPDVGVALACYNGGPSVIGRPREQWFQESQDYYAWGTGIWAAASSGQATSTTLENWLQAGGSGLCTRAQEVQEQFDPIQALWR